MAMWKKDKNYGGAFRPGFSTPPARWNSSVRQMPVMLPRSERKQTSFDRSFYVKHSLPAIDSPYARAKHVQVVEKDPKKAVPMFWAAINAGDRVDSALKDMTLVMKQLNRPDEAIEAIKSFRYLCSGESRDSLDNILLELYKRAGRMEEHLGMLKAKIMLIEDQLHSGRKVRIARTHGKRSSSTLEQEHSRLLGNLAWAYLRQNKYTLAEELYRKALSYEQDRNKQCNLAICLMYMNKIAEAKSLLECVRSSKNGLMEATYAKSFKRASQILIELESHGCEETRKPFSSFFRRDLEEDASKDQNSGFVVSRKLADGNQKTPEKDELKRVLYSWNDTILSSSHIGSPESTSLGPGIGLQSSHESSFAGKLHRERSYLENYNERTGSISKWNDNREMLPKSGLDYESYMRGYISPNPVGGSPRVPFTPPRKDSSFSFNNTAGGCNRKLSFAGIGEQGDYSVIGQASVVEECSSERQNDQVLQSQWKPIKGNEEFGRQFSLDLSNRGWANKGAEADVQLSKNKYFDENTINNIYFRSLVPQNQTEPLSHLMGSLVLEDKYSQATNADISTNQEVRCSVQEAKGTAQVWQLPWLFGNMK